MKVRLVLAGLLILLLIVGGIWQPHDPNAIDLAHRFAAPSLGHPFGLDNLGRDLLSRVMVGGWRTAAVILSVGAIGLFGGAAAGTMAAILGGSIEAIVMRAAETFIVVPTLIVALVAAALFGLSPLSAGLALGLAGLGPYALMAQTLTRTALRQPYVLAARALGVNDHALMMRHVLPATVPLLLTYAGGQTAGSAVAYASLAFIGLGADPSQPDWGSMLHDYRLFLFDHPMLPLWPGLALVMTAAFLNVAFDRRE